MDEPAEIPWDGSLEGLFAALDDAYRTGTMPGRPYQAPPADDAVTPGGIAGGAVQPELFADPGSPPVRGGNRGEGRRRCSPEGRPFLTGEPAALFPDLRGSVSAALLLELSAAAFDGFIFAWMSELPVEGEILRFGWKVLAAARGTAACGTAAAGNAPAADTPIPPAEPWAACPGARREAERAASDRGDPDVRAVLAAACKVDREIERLKGFLRFTPVGGGEDGLYLARCSPDHHVLPALAEHFTLRFGTRDWAVVDERRGIALLRRSEGAARLVPASLFGQPGPAADGYEGLWRHYHRTINNESRSNPALQRQCMPRRYWKYLSELR
ncbi:MAG: TIGR03915 family putative DNA repair protein [Treponema sp.]|jgi:hypothetical protein|nr:TIGR03915 family putative DNA repair protein [Treponema sp.]